MLLVKILIMFNGAKTPRALINSRWIAGKYCAIVRNSGLSPKNFKVEKAEKSCASFSKRDWFTTQRDVVWLSWSTLILLKLSPSINNMESVISRAIISTQHQHVNDQHALLVRQSVDLRRQKLVFEIFFVSCCLRHVCYYHPETNLSIRILRQQLSRINIGENDYNHLKATRFRSSGERH